MVLINVNAFRFLVKSNFSVLEACQYIGVYIPRYCYHETLSVAGNCRMCLIEIANSPKPMVACALPVISNMQIYTDTPLVKKARENIGEILLINHPLDCPICDQGGECDLQNQSTRFGSDRSRFFFNKRGVEDKYCGPLIKTIMTRCIHCTRCVRFSVEIAGVDFLGTLNRGYFTEIGSYLQGVFKSEISGNVIDLCPVGALTSNPYAFKARSWEIRNYESVDLSDGTGSNIQIHFKGSEIIRISPKINFEINGSIISDRIRFSFDSYKNKRIIYPIILQKELKGVKSVKETWNTVLSEIKFNCKFGTLLLLDRESDSLSMILSKYLASVSNSNIQVRTFNNNLNDSNLNISWNVDKITTLQTKAKVCFIISSDLRLESAIINAKLRTKYLDENCLIFGNSLNFSSTVPLQLVNLNLRLLLNFFEAKTQVISNLLTSFVSPILCVGEKFFLNGIFKRSFFSFSRFLNPSINILDIKLFCNSSGSDFLNFKNLNSMDLFKTEELLSLNLNDTFLFNKILNCFSRDNTKKFLGCTATNWTKSLKFANSLFPVFNELEEEQHYTNLEQRPQKTTFFFKGIGESQSVKTILALFINKFLIKKYNLSKVVKYYAFNSEISEDAYLFGKVNSLYSKKSLDYSNSFNLHKVSLLPVKQAITDFYLFGRNSKYSPLMVQLSQTYKSQKKSFEF